jgi:transposase
MVAHCPPSVAGLRDRALLLLGFAGAFRRRVSPERAGRAHRTVLNGMLYRHATGCQWRDLPERYGSWSTVHSGFQR